MQKIHSRKHLNIAATMVVVGALLFATAGAASAEEPETPLSAITDAAPDVLTALAPVETNFDGSANVVQQAVSGTNVTVPCY